jgi:hypothetical protein
MIMHAEGSNRITVRVSDTPTGLSPLGPVRVGSFESAYLFVFLVCFSQSC